MNLRNNFGLYATPITRCDVDLERTSAALHAEWFSRECCLRFR